MASRASHLSTTVTLDGPPTFVEHLFSAPIAVELRRSHLGMRLVLGSHSSYIFSTIMKANAGTILEAARRCLELEAHALNATRDSLDERFVDVIHAAAETIARGNKLILTGVGKNAPICQKISSTFGSTGVSSIFLDPIQALHGDLGFCSPGDLAFLLSNSGETEELLRLLPHLKRLGLKTVAMTSVADSEIASLCDYLALYLIDQEACPLQLAPTSSTTAALALGDSIAMILLELRGFDRNDFAKFHPGGSLGRSLLLRVSDVMRKDDRFASAQDTVTVREALLVITKAKCGTLALTDQQTGKLSGVFTDGDFRRASLQDEFVLQRPVSFYMGRNPVVINENALAAEALRVFETHNVNDIIAVDAGHKPVGLVDGQDMPRMKIV